MKRLIPYLLIIIIPVVLLAGFLLTTSVLATPQQETAVITIYETNVRDGSFTVAWLTDTSSSGTIEYGTSASLGQTADDIRGSGYSGETHYVDISGLLPETLYYYDIISGGVRDDNNGQHYSLYTGTTLDLPPQGNCSYGQVFQSDGSTLAEGAIVLITLQDNNGSGSSGSSAPMSSLVDEFGYWQACFANARVETLDAYFTYSSPGDNATLFANGGSSGTATAIVDVSATSPAGDLILSASQTCIDVAVASGWNMTSVPLIANDMTLAALFPDVVAPAYFYTSSYQEVNGGDALSTGIGYWMYFDEAHSYQICGDAVSSKAIVVVSGWNMIGPFDEAFPVSEITSTPAGILTLPVYGYNTSYFEAISLQSGSGYWVNMDQDGTLHLVSGTP